MRGEEEEEDEKKKKRQEEEEEEMIMKRRRRHFDTNTPPYCPSLSQREGSVHVYSAPCLARFKRRWCRVPESTSKSSSCSCFKICHSASRPGLGVSGIDVVQWLRLVHLNVAAAVCTIELYGLYE